MTIENVSRDLRIDGAKGVLIVLVIFGHLLELFIAKSPLYQAVCSAIYVFHMPLFVLIAGMFSKADMGTRDYRSIVARLVVPLVIFQCVYVGLIAIKSGKLATPPLQPHWILWFLMSLVCWRLALPLFVRIRYPLLVALAITLAAGFNSEIGYAFTLARTLYFFPFFIIGHLYGRQIVTLALRQRLVMGLMFGSLIAGVMWWSFNGLPHDAMYGSKGYQLIRVIDSDPMLGRALLLAVSGATAISALSLVAVTSRVMVYLGQRSLTVFVLHGLAVMGLGTLRLSPTPLLLVILVVVAMAIAIAAARFDSLLNKLYELLAKFITPYRNELVALGGAGQGQPRSAK